MQMLSEGNSRPTLAMELQMNRRRQQWHGHHNFGSNHVVGYSARQNNVKYVAGEDFTFGSQ
jgi:hypothetical protein